MLRHCDYGFTRISKPIARKLHKQGREVYISPCNMRFENPWVKYGAIPVDENFDRFVNYFEIYSCTNKTTGEYAAFYTKLEE